MRKVLIGLGLGLAVIVGGGAAGADRPAPRPPANPRANLSVPAIDVGALASARSELVEVPGGLPRPR